MNPNEVVLPFTFKGTSRYKKTGDTFFVISEKDTDEIDIFIKLRSDVYKKENKVLQYKFDIIFDEIDDQIMIDCLFDDNLKYPIKLFFEDDKYILTDIEFKTHPVEGTEIKIYKNDKMVAFYDKRFRGDVHISRKKEVVKEKVLDCLIEDGVENPSKYLCFLRRLNFTESRNTGYSSIDEFNYEMCISNSCTF